MTLLDSGLAVNSLMPSSESYVDLLRSGPHWLFELTLEVVSAPVVFLAGRAWRNGVLQHLHRDLHALRDDSPRKAAADPERQTVHLTAARALPCAKRSTPNRGRPARAVSPASRLPVSAFSIPFGLAGLAGTWSYAAHRHLVPELIGTALGVASAAMWVLMMGAYLRQGRVWRGSVTDLQDPAAGPFTALLLLTPLLLTVQAHAVAPSVALPLFDALTVLMLALAGWLTGQWIYQPLELNQLHPGYFLPSVAGGYVASIGAATFGQSHLAEMLFGLGSASWLVLSPLILGRLISRPPLPDALLPTIAIEIAPSALATLAWLTLNGGRLDAITTGLAGYGILMVLAQLRLLPAYRRLPSSLSMWAFTFPTTAVATATLHWLALAHPAGDTAWSVLILSAVTLLVAFIATRTAFARHPVKIKFLNSAQHADGSRRRLELLHASNPDVAQTTLQQEVTTAAAYLDALALWRSRSYTSPSKIH